MIKKLVGENVALGPVDSSHLPKILKWMNDMDVLQYLTTVNQRVTEDNEKIFMEKVLKDPLYHYYGIFLDEELIGSVGLKDVDLTNRTAALGIVIGEKQHWDKGYGTEAIHLLLDYAFNVLNINNIILTTIGFNDRAVRCYEKAGFKVIGKRRKARFYGGKYHDEIYMDMLADEFR